MGFVGKTEGDSIYEYKSINGSRGFNRNRTIFDMLREIEYKPLPETFNLESGDIVIVAPTKDMEQLLCLLQNWKINVTIDSIHLFKEKSS